MKQETVIPCRCGCVLFGALALAFISTISVGQETKPEAAASSQPSADLPEASTIFARYIEAIGGKDALLKTVSRHIRGTFSVPAQGMEGSLEMFRSIPNKLLIRINIPGMGDITQGFDGQVGFTSSPMQGTSILEGNQLRQIGETAGFYTELHRAEKFTSMETVELTEFEGEPCYKVKLISKAGREYAEFFDQQTGLLAGNVGEQDIPGRTIEQITVYSDYKRFGDLLLPTRTAVRVMNFEQVMTYESIEFNTVDETVYVLPEDVEALLKPKPSTQPDEN
ncbi:MAG: hypothetical protein V3T84_13615 [Phycisphaerales bacterium]